MAYDAARDVTVLFGGYAGSGGYGYDFAETWELRFNYCPADFDHDGFVNGDDYDFFAEAFDAADPAADFNADGFVNGDDYDAFAEHFDVGC